MILALQGRGVVSPGQRFHDRARGHSSSPGLSGSSRQHKKTQVFFFASRGEKVKVVGSQRVGVNVYPLTLSFSGESGRV